MTAATSADSLGAAAGPALDRPAAEFRRWSVGALVGLLAMAAALVVWRRLAGALQTPLHPLLLLCVAALVAAVSVGTRLIWHFVPTACRSRRLNRLVTLLPSVAIAALGAALSLRETGAGGLVAFWTPVVAGELWAWRLAIREGPFRRQGASRPSRPIRTDPPEAFSPHPPHQAGLADVCGGIPAENVLQRLTRSRTDDGSEEFSGWLRTPFAAGQRTANVHVAFCPPFPKTPELSVEQLDGPPTRIKTAQLLPHGARFDLKLSETAPQQTSVLLQFSARSQHAG